MKLRHRGSGLFSPERVLRPLKYSYTVLMRYQAMLKYFLSLALVLGVSTPAISNPFCYMVTPQGELINLESMCSISEPQPAIAANDSAETTPNAVESGAAQSSIASFQVTNIARDGKAKGRVTFTRAAEEGSTVSPYVVFADGRRQPVGSVTRTRGQRRVDIEFSLPPGTTTSEVEGGI